MFRRESVSSETTASGMAVVALEGSFDLANSAEVGYALGRALSEGHGSVAVDLSGVAFLDATMLHVLLDGLAHAHVNRGTLVLVRPNPHVWRTFEVVALDRVFPVYATLDEACRAQPSAPLQRR